MGGRSKGSREETWKSSPGTRELLSYERSTLPRFPDARRPKHFLHLLPLAASMMIAPRFAFFVLSVCSPLWLSGAAGAQGIGGQQVISTFSDGVSVTF